MALSASAPQKMAPRKVYSMVGIVGWDPESKDTSKGPVVSFPLYVTTTYGAMGSKGDSRKVRVSVWKAPLQAEVMGKVVKGGRVAVEGFLKESEWQGKKQFDLSASRVGQVDWFHGGSAAANNVKPEDDDDTQW